MLLIGYFLTGNSVPCILHRYIGTAYILFLFIHAVQVYGYFLYID